MYSPDYKDLDSDYAMKDFKERIEHYRHAYEPLSVEHDGSVSQQICTSGSSFFTKQFIVVSSARHFIQIFDVGQRFLVNKIRGMAVCM